MLEKSHFATLRAKRATFMFKVVSVPTTLRKLPFLPHFCWVGKRDQNNFAYPIKGGKMTLPTQQKGDKIDFDDPTKKGVKMTLPIQQKGGKIDFTDPTKRG